MGFVDKWPSRMQGQRVFQCGWAGISFRSDPKNIYGFLYGELPLPESTSPEKFVRGGEMFKVLH